MTLESRHLSERIGRPAEEVYTYASDPANLPRWAPGLGNSVEQVEGHWFVDTPAGRVRLAFAPRNDFGILDHYLTLGSGEVIYIPMRVIADESGSEVLFTLRRRPDMTDAEFKADADAVMADLARLKQILERLRHPARSSAAPLARHSTVNPQMRPPPAIDRSRQLEITVTAAYALTTWLAGQASTGSIPS